MYTDSLSIDVLKAAAFTSFNSSEALISTGNDCVQLITIYHPPASRKHGQPANVFLEVLDLVLTRSTDNIDNNLLVHPPEISDHSAITLTLPYHKPIAEKKKP